MVLGFVVSAALAAPAGFRQISEAVGCKIWLGPADAAGVAPMSAECVWPEVNAAKLGARLARVDGFGDLVFAIVAEKIVRVDGARTLVHQVQSAPVIADREVLLWMTTSHVGDCWRTAWKTAAEESLTLASGRVRTARNDGAWEVCVEPTGGARVVHDIWLDPGGSVPNWLVRRFQSGGLTDVLTAVRGKAQAL